MSIVVIEKIFLHWINKIIEAMKTADLNTKLVDSYFGLLKSLSTNNKLDLIAKLTQSVKAETEKELSNFYKAFGSWDEKESADELVSSIRDSRTFNRDTEELWVNTCWLQIFVFTTSKDYTI